MARKSSKSQTEFWATYRIHTASVDIVRDAAGKPVELKRHGSTGHRCPNEGCENTLTWGNTVLMRCEFYLVLCLPCQNGFTMTHAYIVSLNPAPTAGEPEAPKAAEDTPW